ncbi:HEAT repeat domain-containing protein [Halobellus sp. H-GB7]|uniref:HEAT repeat domain-containing protein n=1 Tax=Halobellus sp. H-GB7 TaxID=3069756 RepID=UPI0027B00699|nr:HEAT repeat domain-containing protein [Halobellus sp. H-GB7]MDQ2056348.1 HEAT repeat domain-containing protein [Halobellus sp. H-GB7]
MSSSSVVSSETLLLLGGIILLLLTTVATLTVSRSILSQRTDRRDAEALPRVRQTLLERMEATDPEWEEWVEGLSASERRVATDLLEDYLQRIRGGDRTSLQRLGYALGIDQQARRKLHDGDHIERRWALHWIARLDVDVTTATLEATCGDHPETRAAAARVLYEQERPDAAQAGTALLLRGSSPMSVLGIDTLYHLNKLSPGPLVTSARGSYDEWSESRLIQVLRVIGKAGPVKPQTDLGWIGFLFLSNSPTVRAAAAESLFGYGWHNDVRSVVEVDQVRTDGSPQVRRAVYRMLGSWGDEVSTNALCDAIRTESNPRAAIDAISALGERSTRLPESELSTASSAARDWVLASTDLRHRETVR